ncbi:MAG: DUF3558 family protein [Nocardioidaceae bacterium]
MRTTIAAAAALCLLLAGCSSGDGSPDAAPGSTPATSGSTASSGESASSGGVEVDENGEPDPCSLLSHDEAEGLAGRTVGDARPTMSASLLVCQWLAEDGLFVQVQTAPSPEWALALPEIVRIVQESGDFAGTPTLARLRKAGAMIEAGKVLSSTKACALFSELLELQGRPPGTTRTVNLIPTRKDPQAVSGQTCSAGRFTSVMVGNRLGLDGRVPVTQVARATMRVHQRALTG